MISVDNIVKRYSGQSAERVMAAVDGVSFAVADGEFYTLLGPSGCGKTTTLRCVAGLERLDGGTITFNDVVVASSSHFVPANRRGIGMVFQSYAVWPHMTVFENVAFPLRVDRKARRHGDLRRSVLAALELVGLAQLAQRSATQLSGGQQQRLALARAVVNEPSVLLLDEPLSNLDAALRERMRSEIRDLQQRLGITTIFVTHDQREALSMSDRVAVMHQGRILQEGTPREIYFEVKHEFVARFIGGTNVIYGTTAAPRGLRGWRVDTPLGPVYAEGEVALPPNADGVAIAIRPEDIRIASGANGTQDEFARSKPHSRSHRPGAVRRYAH